MIDINPYYAIGVPAAIAIVTFMVQVFCEVQKTKHSPGTVLESIQKQLKRAFRKIGEWIAFLSSYLQWLKLETLGDAAIHLLGPLAGILVSWRHLFIGYFKKCFSYATPLSICIGTLLPFIVSVALMALYTNWLTVAGQFLLEKVGPGPIQAASLLSLVACGTSVAYYQKCAMDRPLEKEEKGEGEKSELPKTAKHHHVEK